MRSNNGPGSRAQKEVIRRPKNMKVYLSEHAFMGLLLSCAEVFQKESLGYLLGYRLHDRFIIEYAFGLQTAKRKRRGVILHHRDKMKIEPILSKFVKLQIHTPYGDEKGIPIPSVEDINGMEKDNLYLIIAINELNSTKPWKENRDGSISGSMGNFFFKISAYFCPDIKGIPLRSRIYCPFPPGLRVG